MLNLQQMTRRLHHRVPLLAILMLLMLLSFSCKREIDAIVFTDEETKTVADFVRENQETFGYFWQIIEQGDLVHTLSSYNPHGLGYTLFLPGDDAFERYIRDSNKYGSFEELLGDQDFIMELGRYHLVNTMLRSSDFPYGALPDTTMTGEFLTIAFESGEDSIAYLVNSVAPVTIPNIELVNGFVHVIQEVLDPVIYSSYDWLINKSEFSILAEALTVTGLGDTLGLYKSVEGGQIVKNRYTVLAEPDSLFHRSGIESFEELAGTYGTPGLEWTDPNNGLYQFAAYHVLEGSYFLDEFSGSSNYNTFASFPVSINASGIDIMINTGVDTFGLEVQGQDTTVIDFLSFQYQQSNILTKSGPIHVLSEVMEPFKPNLSTRTFQFYEEEEIVLASKQSGTYEFVDKDDFSVISWTGPDEIEYVKSSSSEEKAINKDYLRIEGRFTLDYTMSKILPGRYQVILKAHAWNGANATIQVFLDGQRKGGNLNLTTGGDSGNPYKEYVVGGVEFSSYTEHHVSINALIPGIMIWDYIRFVPEKTVSK